MSSLESEARYSSQINSDRKKEQCSASGRSQKKPVLWLPKNDLMMSIIYINELQTSRLYLVLYVLYYY